jgi:hypothetical protein
MALKSWHETVFANRKGLSAENDELKITVLTGGGHVAEISRLSKGPESNPLWVPPWPSIEPEDYDIKKHEAVYGPLLEGKLLASIMGHNICLDYFGPPSDAEAKQSMTVHGEAPVSKWEAAEIKDGSLTYGTVLKEARIKITRNIKIKEGEEVVCFSEEVENLSALDRPITWNQHVTLGPPYLKKGKTVFDMPAGWGKTFEEDFSEYMRFKKAKEFTWPNVPGKDGETINLRVAPNEKKSGDFSTQLLDRNLEWVWFSAADPEEGLLLVYIFRQKDFPWIGNWEENYARDFKPWDGKTLTRGMEFSVSPFPEPKPQAIARDGLQGVPTFKWVGAKEKIRAHYMATLLEVEKGYKGVDSVEVLKDKIVIKERETGKIKEVGRSAG